MTIYSVEHMVQINGKLHEKSYKLFETEEKANAYVEKQVAKALNRGMDMTLAYDGYANYEYQLDNETKVRVIYSVNDVVVH